MWRTAALLIALPSFAHANEIAEVTGLVGALEKVSVIGLLIVACYFLSKEIIRARVHAHKLRNELVNCHQAREIWKTAFTQAKAECDHAGIKLDGISMTDMLAREERLLKPIDP